MACVFSHLQGRPTIIFFQQNVYYHLLYLTVIFLFFILFWSSYKWLFIYSLKIHGYKKCFICLLLIIVIEVLYLIYIDFINQFDLKFNESSEIVIRNEFFVLLGLIYGLVKQKISMIRVYFFYSVTSSKLNFNFFFIY